MKSPARKPVKRIRLGATVAVVAALSALVALVITVGLWLQMYLGQDPAALATAQDSESGQVVMAAEDDEPAPDPAPVVTSAS